MDDSGVLGKVLGQLGDTAKKTGGSLVKVPKDLAEAAAEQVRSTVGSQAKAQGDPSTSVRLVSPQALRASKKNIQTNQDAKDIVKSLYGQSDKTERAAVNSSQQQSQPDLEKRMADKTPEEQKKLLELRQKLHKETYYEPTFNPAKKQEERPAEKVENEKKKEMQELQEKEAKKPPPLAVQRAQRKTEMMPGTGG